MKWQEEQLLLSAAPNISKRIYRVSSAYGFIQPNVRRGLIPALIYNGLRKSVSLIMGQMTTLRDYVFGNDLGNFIAQLLAAADPIPDTDIFFLVSAKASSLCEVQQIVAKVIGHKIYIALDSAPSNDRNITFSADVLPDDWRPTDLQTGIRAIYSRWITRGSASGFHDIAR